MGMVTLTKWHVLVASIWAAVGCGFAYTFSTFSVALKHDYNLSQSNLDTVGIATTVIGFITFTCGLMVDRFGATRMIIVGGLLNSASWFVFACLAVGSVGLFSPTAIFTLLAMLATYGAALTTGAVFGTLAKTFGDAERARAIGIAKAWVGIASGLATTIFIGIFPSQDTSHQRLHYIFFLSGFCALFILAPAPFIRVITRSIAPAAGEQAPSRPEELDRLWLPQKRRFDYLTGVTLLVIALTVTVAFLTQEMSDSVRFGFSLALSLVAAMPWVLLLPGGASTADLAQSSLARDVHVAESPSSLERTQSPWRCGPLEMVQRIDMWMLWFVIFALQAGGIVLTTNLGNIVSSRPGYSVPSTSAVALFSAAQSLGRLFGGTISDAVVRTKRFTRPAYFVVLNLQMAIAHAVLLTDGPASLYIGVLLAGWCFGSMYPVMIVVIAELFGTERIASNYMIFDGFPAAAASFSIAKFFAQYVYQQHEVGNDCHGAQCYNMTYICVICFQIAAALVASILAYRSRVVYRVTIWGADAPSTPSLGTSLT